MSQEVEMLEKSQLQTFYRRKNAQYVLRAFVENSWIYAIVAKEWFFFKFFWFQFSFFMEVIDEYKSAVALVIVRWLQNKH